MKYLLCEHRIIWPYNEIERVSIIQVNDETNL